MASPAAAAEPKPPEDATKVKGANEVNRRLMALSEEDRRSVFRRILALAKERCVEITRTFYQPQAKQWNVRCRGGPSYVIEVEHRMPTRAVDISEQCPHFRLAPLADICLEENHHERDNVARPATDTPQA